MRSSSPLHSNMTVKLSDLSELKESYPLIKDIHLVNDAYIGSEVNLLLKLFLKG